MEIKVFNTASEASEFVASEILEQVKVSQNCQLGLATGRTMDAIYHKLVQMAVTQKTDFSKVKTFAVDEYIGLSSGDCNSYEEYLKLHLLDQLNFRKSNIFIPATNSQEIDQCCLDYEAAIRDSGGIDLQLLGLGLNGHIGLNEPGSSVDSRTRVVALTSTTRNSNKVLFRKDSVPVTAVTMGIGTILESKKCILIATGQTKAEIVQKVINGDVNSKIPATNLKQHPNLLIVLDVQAAKLI